MMYTISLQIYLEISSTQASYTRYRKINVMEQTEYICLSVKNNKSYFLLNEHKLKAIYLQLGRKLGT